MKTQRENDSSRAMHSPEEHAYPVLGRLREVHIPQQHFPVERAALGPKRRAEDLAISPISRSHETLGDDRELTHETQSRAKSGCCSRACSSSWLRVPSCL